MSLIKSISGFRGTIGGKPTENLTPKDIVAFASGYAQFIKETYPNQKAVIAVGRDGRMSGEMVQNLVSSTLVACGVEVRLIDYTTTPTLEMYVLQNAEVNGGVILTASHNPKEWNALKLLNKDGEFVSADQGARILELADSDDLEYVSVDELGKVVQVNNALSDHIQAITDLSYIDTDLIASKNFKVVLDAINSTASIAMPAMLAKLGVTEVVVINDDCSGEFAHNPEPLNHNIVDLCEAVKANGAHLGVAVDPDVDRLSLIDENGNAIGEEYTLVAIADYLLEIMPGATVSNLSSSRALRDITQKHGQQYFASAVGEVNVVNAMKANKAVVGGEGNGGVILPDLHYGRDAMVGVALILAYMAKSERTLSDLRASYTDYSMIKDKMELSADMDVDAILAGIKSEFEANPNVQVNDIDGVKLDFDNGWVHCRKSNTEPIIRLYAEAASEAEAKTLVNNIRESITV